MTIKADQEQNGHVTTKGEDINKQNENEDRILQLFNVWNSRYNEEDEGGVIWRTCVHSCFLKNLT